MQILQSLPALKVAGKIGLPAAGRKVRWAILPFAWYHIAFFSMARQLTAWENVASPQ